MSKMFMNPWINIESRHINSPRGGERGDQVSIEYGEGYADMKNNTLTQFYQILTQINWQIFIGDR